jgi:cysteinyl-tRNA synthetase
LFEFEGRFLAALDDDFNTARALGDVFKMVQQARALMSGPGADDAKALARKNLQVADEILGLLPRESSAQAPGSASAWVQALVDLRERARTSKNYALADNLREVLAQMGYRIEDTRQGPVVVAANGLRTESGQTRERF